MRIAVIGATGRLGAMLTKEFLRAGHEVAALKYPDFDITKPTQVAFVLSRLEPEAIVNCSAYSAVDTAETNPAAAFAINAHGPSFLAAAAEAAGAALVHFSTDFVFDGETDRPYSESDPVNPLGVYGASKKSGEDECRRIKRHYILRLESLFGGAGLDGHQATVDYLADGILAGRPVRAMSDRTLSPSYVPDVVKATLAFIERGDGYGTYHCVSSGCTTWYELAKEIALQLGLPARIEPIRAADLETIARRPRFCALSNAKLLAAGIEMPAWQSAISRHLADRRMPGAQRQTAAARR